MSTKRPRKTAESAKKLIAEALDGLDPAQRSAVAKRIAEIPTSCRKGYILAVVGKASPRAAIRAHCLECCCWERPEVTECTGLPCSLRHYRPKFKEASK